MIVTNVPLSSYSLYAFWKSLLAFYKEHMPFPIEWVTIEGYWPYFQLTEQEGLGTFVLKPKMPHLVLRPTAVEIEEHLNFPWRVDTPATHALMAHYLPPLHSGAELQVFTKMLRIRGTFDVDITTQSALQTFDHTLHTLATFNNRWRYVDLRDYPLLIPIVWLQNQDPVWHSELISSPSVVYAYVPVTGECHYYFSLNIRPMVRVAGVSYSSNQDEGTYTLTVSHEFNTSIPVWFIFQSPRWLESVKVTVYAWEGGEQYFMLSLYPPGLDMMIWKYVVDMYSRWRQGVTLVLKECITEWKMFYWNGTSFVEIDPENVTVTQQEGELCNVEVKYTGEYIVPCPDRPLWFFFRS